MTRTSPGLKVVGFFVFCEQRIGCRDLYRKDNQKFSQTNRYAFECLKCSSSALLYPERELQQVQTRCNHSCVTPAQEPKETIRTMTTERTEPTPWPHSDQETSSARRTRRCQTSSRLKRTETKVTVSIPDRIQHCEKRGAEIVVKTPQSKQSSQKALT